MTNKLSVSEIAKIELLEEISQREERLFIVIYYKGKDKPLICSNKLYSVQSNGIIKFRMYLHRTTYLHISDIIEIETSTHR